MIASEEPKLPQADVFNTLFQCHSHAVVFSVLPGYDLPAHQSQKLNFDKANPHLPASLDDLYDSNSITMPACDFEQLCSQVFDKLEMRKKEVAFL